MNQDFETLVNEDVENISINTISHSQNLMWMEKKTNKVIVPRQYYG
jgi:hypothetical protein